MRLEHCRPPVCDWTFTTTNYGVETDPRREWELVAGAAKGGAGGAPAEDSDFGRDGRQLRSVDNLMQLDLTATAGLKREEVIAVVLYTGPMVPIRRLDAPLLECLTVPRQPPPPPRSFKCTTPSCGNSPHRTTSSSRTAISSSPPRYSSSSPRCRSWRA